MEELKLMLPELNPAQLNWLEIHINLKAAEAEKQGFTEGYELANPKPSQEDL